MKAKRKKNNAAPRIFLIRKEDAKWKLNENETREGEMSETSI